MLWMTLNIRQTAQCHCSDILCVKLVLQQTNPIETQKNMNCRHSPWIPYQISTVPQTSTPQHSRCLQSGLAHPRVHQTPTAAQAWLAGAWLQRRQWHPLSVAGLDAALGTVRTDVCMAPCMTAGCNVVQRSALGSEHRSHVLLQDQMQHIKQ